ASAPTHFQFRLAVANCRRRCPRKSRLNVGPTVLRVSCRSGELSFSWIRNPSYRKVFLYTNFPTCENISISGSRTPFEREAAIFATSALQLPPKQFAQT